MMMSMNRKAEKRSSALVATMLLVSLLAVLLVGFVGSMRWEIFSARTHLGGVRASFYAQAGVDMALARMTNAMSDGSRFWSSQPGRLMMSARGAVQPVNTLIDLSSGSVLPTATADQAADLNIRHMEDAARNLLSAGNVMMKVKWIYVHKDGTFDLVPPTGAPGANPVVGRFAFWVDDESTKVNLNTAWSRDSSVNTTNLLSHASRISMGEIWPLTMTEVAKIVNFRTANHYLNSPTEVALVEGTGNIAGMVRTNAFSITHYNHEPNLNMFGQERILLTTQKRLADAAGTTNYLDILAVPDTDPGRIIKANGTFNIDVNKVNALVNRIYSQFIRADWPALPGQSIAGKYAPASNPERVIQLILNIIDYVRSTESATSVIVEPLRGSWTSGAFAHNKDAANGNVFFGNSRRISIVEVGAYVPSTYYNVTTVGAQKYYSWLINYYYKIYMPPQIGGGSALGQDLTQLYTGVAHDVGFNAASPYTSGSDTRINATNIVAGSSFLNPGDFATLKVNHTLNIFNTTARPTQLSAVVFLANPLTPLSSTVGVRTERVPISGVINYTIDPAAVLEPAIKTMSIKDPFVNKISANWTLGGNTLANAPVFGGGSATAPESAQQDTDNAGNLSSASIAFPPVSAYGKNIYGRVLSVGELGYMHTGVECGTIVGATGTIFRTLRLQPRATGSATLPDWAVLDLFAAPPPTVAVTAKPYLQPNTFHGGKININSKIYPFTQADGVTPQVSRYQPIAALLAGATSYSSTVSSAQSRVLASNIVNRVLATGSRTTGMEYATNVYFAPGQMAEIKGVADGGEEGEKLVSDALALATTRSGVYSIYSVGQAILQDKSGKITVQGERRYQYMFERLKSGTAVKFSPVYARDVNP